MFRRLVVSGAFCASLLAAPASAEVPPPGCIDPTLLSDRTVVIAPCTALIEAPGASAPAQGRHIEYRARGLAAANRVEEAIADVEAGLVLAPNDVGLLIVRATLHDRQGRWPRAWADAQLALRLEPDQVRAYLNAISLSLGWPDQDPAIVSALLDTAERVAPGHVALLMYRAEYEGRRGAYRKAVAAADAAFAHPDAATRRASGWLIDRQSVPADAALHVTRGRAHLSLRDWDAAARDFDAAVAIERSALLLSRRAQHLIYPPGRAGPEQLIAAERDIAEALAKHAKYSFAHRIHGQILSQGGRDREAVEAYNRAISLADGAVLRWERGRIWRTLGRQDLAFRDFKTSFVMDPYVRESLVKKLQRAGYLDRGVAASEVTQAAIDGLEACSFDERCY